MTRRKIGKYLEFHKSSIFMIVCSLGYERNFFRFGRKWIDSRDVPYDYDSIMHYNRAFFSRFPVMLDTLIPLKGVQVGQRKALSRFDILQANLLYQCDGKHVIYLFFSSVTGTWGNFF